jgi:sugar phosphate isomerase/epimerase
MRKMTRRKMLQNSALATGAAITWGAWPGGNELRAMSSGAIPGPDLKFPATTRDRLAVATWPFRASIESPSNEYRDKKQPGVDLREFAAGVKKTFGVPGVEPLSSHFPSTDSPYLHAFREGIEKAGVRVVNIPVDNSESYYDADPAARQKAVDNGKKWVDIAVTIGSPSLRTSIAPARNAQPEVATVAQQVQKLVEYAASKNILVNLENDNLVSEDAFFLVKVIKKVNSPYLHALPDFCNSMQSGNEQFNYEAVTALFPLAYNICHVKDSEVGDDGKVVRVDLKKTFAILKASNYRGYCSMEWEGPGSPYDGTRFLIKSSLENLG